MRFVAALVAGLLVVVGVGLAIFLRTSQTVEQPPAVEEPDTTEADIEAIKDLVARFDFALEANDADALAALYLPNAVRMSNESPLWDGRDAIRAGFARDFEQGELGQITNVVEAVVIMGNHAVARGSATETLTPEGGGEVYSRTAKWMGFFVRSSDGSWHTLWDIWNRDAPPAEQ